MSALAKYFLSGALLLLLLSLGANQSVLARVDAPPVGRVHALRAPDAPLPLNHFYCYRYQGPAVNERVRLQDQFDTRPKRATVGEPARFCNPVRKTHNNVITPILFPNDHLIAYNIGTHKDPAALQVRVRNQFGKQKLEVYLPAEVLMVPTRKAPHPRPQDTDHFKCYFVKGDGIFAALILQDQWQTKTVVDLEPFGLCNPTRKKHGDVWTGVNHANAHLVCYNVLPQTFVKDVKTANQFRKEKFTVQSADVLCVPSVKRIVTQ